MEKWDGYTRDGQLTDVILTRGEPLPKGIYHITCETVVRHTDGDYLLMLRDKSKPLYPGLWEIGSAGSALSGESPLYCIKRELYEETGIRCDNFTFISEFIGDDTQYIMKSFLCITDCRKSDIRLQPGETTDYRWLTEREFIDFINSDEIIDTQRDRLSPWFESMGYIRKLL